MNTKPGYKTTEFWTCLASIAASAAGLLGSEDATTKICATVLIATIAIAYTVSRTIHKQAN